MSTKHTLKEDHQSEIEERSEEELLEEEIRNQQTLDSFVESDKNWSWLNLFIYLGESFELKKITILNSGQRQKRNGIYQGSLQEKNSSWNRIL